MLKNKNDFRKLYFHSKNSIIQTYTVKIATKKYTS